MKTVFWLTGLVLALATTPLIGATIIVSDNFTATNVNSGFLLGEGLNSGINPPTTTRLQGTAAADLRYLKRGNKGDTAYTISGNKCNITQGSQSGRFTISADGSTPFDFATALGTANATPANPVVYDIGISMNNKVALTDSSIGRMSFGFSTVEAGAGSWNFGVQIIPAVVGGVTNYNIIKRIKTAATGLSAELNATMTNAGTIGSEVTFLLRVTDAGLETDTNYHSRLQVSMDAGTTWFYDTQSDTNLTNGWRFEAATRYVSFDQAANGGADTYDNFSISLISPLIWTGSGVDGNWSTGANWLRSVAPATGTTVVTGDALVFSGTTQQTNFNDFTNLSVSSVTFSNGGFSLAGNSFTLTTGITNVIGDNTLEAAVFLGANGRFQPTAGNLTFNGGINSTGRNLTVSGAGNTTINGAISTGTGTLTRNQRNLNLERYEYLHG